jgi:ABC-type multidrug transport system fused ATPase/permease subunit
MSIYFAVNIAWIAITSLLIVAFQQYVRDFYNPIEQISEQFNTIQDSFSSAEKIFDVLDTKKEVNTECYYEVIKIDEEVYKTCGNVLMRCQDKFNSIMNNNDSIILLHLSTKDFLQQNIYFFDNLCSNFTDYRVNNVNLLLDQLNNFKIKINALEVLVRDDLYKKNRALYNNIMNLLNKLLHLLNSAIKEIKEYKNYQVLSVVSDVYLDEVLAKDYALEMNKSENTTAFDVSSSPFLDLSSFTGSIEFKNVWFYYNEGEWILKDISFRIDEGQTVAFVGSTGSGKSTIINLIVRNYEIIKGNIFLDGIDSKKISVNSIRKQVGQMLQDVFLFSGTIYDNITLNDSSISKESVIQACEYVGIDSFINSLPDNYDYKVIERGSNFSTGQRQLLSFARAICYNPSLMVLDEATANIDTESEQIVQESLKKMSKLSTMIIIAHRISTIQYAHKIIVIKKGEIVEMGTHQELLLNKNIYYHLYLLQYEEKINNL